MNILLKKSFFVNPILSKSFATSQLSLSSSINPLKDAIRFENQNKLWTFKEMEYHSNAFAYGLAELGYKSGDRLGIWLEKAYTSETVAAQLGALKAGVALTPLFVEKTEELAGLIQESGIKGLVFSPNSKVGEESYISALKKTIPELQTKFADESVLNLSKFGKLQHLIHTGFYSIPGTLKYRQILFYVNKRFVTLSLPETDPKAAAFFVQSKEKKFEQITYQEIFDRAETSRKTLKINENDIVFICGEIRFPFQFSLGVLNTLKYGNNLVLTGNQPLKNVSSVIKYHGESIVIADGEAFEKSEAGFNTEETKKVAKVLVNSVTTTPNKTHFAKLFPGLQVDYSSSL